MSDLKHILGEYLSGRYVDREEYQELDKHLVSLVGEELDTFIDSEVQWIRFSLPSWLQKDPTLGEQKYWTGITYKELLDGLNSPEMDPKAKHTAALIIKSIILFRSSIGEYFRSTVQS